MGATSDTIATNETGRLIVWAVSDGRAGIENQALGLAEAIGRLTPALIDVKRVKWRGPLGRLPTWAQVAPLAMLSAESDRIDPPWPDVWIGAGRASLPFSRRVRGWSGGQTFVVQTQDPGQPLTPFDLVVAPRHDALVGANVLSIIGAPNRIAPDVLARELAKFPARFDALPRPRVVVLIGGRSKAYDLSDERARTLGAEVAAAIRDAGGAVLATMSRRTPEAARTILAEAFAGLPGLVFTGEGPNPYPALLAAADVALVTADSTNMLTEAASAGLPVQVLDLPGGAPKFDRLHAELREGGWARPFTGRIERWRVEPLRETERAAEAVVAALHARRR